MDPKWSPSNLTHSPSLSSLLTQVCVVLQLKHQSWEWYYPFVKKFHYSSILIMANICTIFVQIRQILQINCSFGKTQLSRDCLLPAHMQPCVRSLYSLINQVINLSILANIFVNISLTLNSLRPWNKEIHISKKQT